MPVIGGVSELLSAGVFAGGELVGSGAGVIAPVVKSSVINGVVVVTEPVVTMSSMEKGTVSGGRKLKGGGPAGTFNLVSVAANTGGSLLTL